jgi:hypothetical protein
VPIFYHLRGLVEGASAKLCIEWEVGSLGFLSHRLKGWSRLVMRLGSWISRINFSSTSLHSTAMSVTVPPVLALSLAIPAVGEAAAFALCAPLRRRLFPMLLE